MTHGYEPLHLAPGDGGLARSYKDLFNFGSSDDGEVVDALIERTPSEVATEGLLPVVGPAAPERRPCPSMAMFLDIRARLASPDFGLPRRALQPSAQIRKILNRGRVKRLDRYLLKRFGVSVFLQGNTAWRDGLALGLTGTFVSALGMSLLLVLLCILHPGGGDASMLALPLGILAIGLTLTFCTVVPAYIVARLAHWLRLDRGSRIVTFADLIRWIQLQRTGWLKTSP